MNNTARIATMAGVFLMLIGTLFASGADAVLKAVASDYAAPQVLLIAAVLSLGLTVIANGRSNLGQVVRTGAPYAMAGRAVATIVASAGFYHAFVQLPFAEVFLFIGAMPLMAAVLSGPLLGERVTKGAWLVLAIGFLGLFCLFPVTQTSAEWTGQAFAALGSFAGTVSVVLSRHISRQGTHSLAQVFLPQLALAIVMAALFPFVMQPMTVGDFGLVCVYAGLVFGARWSMVVVSRLLPAWLTLQLLNVQFVWMVALGTLFFDETVGGHIFLGAGLIILAGTLLSRMELAKTGGANAVKGHAGEMSGLRQGAAIVRHAARTAD